MPARDACGGPARLLRLVALGAGELSLFLFLFLFVALLVVVVPGETGGDGSDPSVGWGRPRALRGP